MLHGILGLSWQGSVQLAEHYFPSVGFANAWAKQHSKIHGQEETIFQEFYDQERCGSPLRRVAPT